MKKSILNLGKALNKAEQKNVNGGGLPGSPGVGTDESYVGACVDKCNKNYPNSSTCLNICSSYYDLNPYPRQ
ncbi:hypothetical protein [Tenacibaculum salmonis]|uniref:hypothetical protein n=1 Tax=Tenacibaculum sp. P3-BQ1 TaxID=3232310 RepID=UPI0034DE1AFB